MTRSVFRILTIIMLAAFLLMICNYSFAADTISAQGKLLTGTDDVAKLPFWEWRSDSIRFRLVQRLPDQTRAHFMARKFSPEHAEIIANACAFQSEFRNIRSPGSPVVAEYDQLQWKVLVGDRTSMIKTRETWEKQWQQLGVSLTAKIAFKWALLPTRHVYHAGDYNWGMTMFNLKPGTRFDLDFSWRVDGKSYAATIPGIECGPDIHPDPEGFQ